MSRVGDFMIDKNPVDYEKELEAIYQMGYDAYTKGERYSTCPYKVLPLKAVWEDGFMDASIADEPFLEEWNDRLDEEECDHFEGDYRDDTYWDDK
jgi:ribosome modulation factor